MRLTANAGPKKVAKNRHLGTIPQLCPAVSSQLTTLSGYTFTSTATECATYIRQGGHHVGHWPTFLVVYILSVRRTLISL